MSRSAKNTAAKSASPMASKVASPVASQVASKVTSQVASQAASQVASKARLRLWLKLLKLSRQIEGDIRENLRLDFQTTLPRFDVMAALYRYPDGLRMNELSGVLKVSNGNVTGIIDRLVSDSLVTRIAVPGDRRALRVKLTAAGRKLFLKQALQHEGWVDTLLSKLSTDDAELMIGLIDKVCTTDSDREYKHE